MFLPRIPRGPGTPKRTPSSAESRRLSRSMT
nr:MAG TPA: hypothetical protein [Caudoviricetes sp.]